jgi:hypothetical protein
VTAAATPRTWSLRRRLGRSFAVLGLLLAVFGAAVVVFAVRFSTDGNHLIYRWQPATAANQRLLADLVNQETGVRGYVLTHRADTLQPYTEYRRRQLRDTERLRNLIGGDAAALIRLRDVEAAARTWESEIARPLLARVRAGGSPDVARVDAGKGVFDGIRIRAAALGRTLDSRLATERHDRVVDGALAGTFMVLALLVIASAGFALWRGLHRWVLGPMDRLGAQTRAVAGGERDRAIEPGGPRELISLGADVESMRAEIVMQLAAAERSAVELLRQGRELERSNADLQQFAYVASHDLSEPLRKVANFCQLLERQYAAQLDDRAREYIGFAVDGAKRMQTLIGDLLALSRVGRSTADFVPVDLDAALDQALGTLADRIAEAGATIRRGSALPTVPGDPALLTSLLENLVGNAVKYRRSDVPADVLVSAETDGQFWTVSVRDNGIGVYPQYAERIFAVFQRLHLRDQYGGTGIGLALCRKIVDFHGGRIWLDELQSGPGATFRFTLPQTGACRP